MDQVAFIVLNSLSQVNTLVGQRLHSAYYLSKLRLVEQAVPDNRTEVYGLLCRRFKDVETNRGWIAASGILPQTEVWEKWKTEVLKNCNRGLNEIYKTLANSMGRQPKEAPPIYALDAP